MPPQESTVISLGGPTLVAQAMGKTRTTLLAAAADNAANAAVLVAKVAAVTPTRGSEADPLGNDADVRLRLDQASELGLQSPLWMVDLSTESQTESSSGSSGGGSGASPVASPATPKPEPEPRTATTVFATPARAKDRAPQLDGGLKRAPTPGMTVTTTTTTTTTMTVATAAVVAADQKRAARLAKVKSRCRDLGVNKSAETSASPILSPAPTSRSSQSSLPGSQPLSGATPPSASRAVGRTGLGRSTPVRRGMWSCFQFCPPGPLYVPAMDPLTRLGALTCVFSLL